MRLTWFVWFFTGLLALSAVAGSLTTVVPSAQDAAMTWNVICAFGALIGAFTGLWLNGYPREHWVHQSRPLWTGFIVIAMTVTVAFAGIFAF
jgi:hypothetical protein